MAPCDIITGSRIAPRNVIPRSCAIRRTRKRQSTRACTRSGLNRAPRYCYTLVRPSPPKGKYAISRKEDAGVAQAPRDSRANEAIEACQHVEECAPISRKRVEFDLAAISMHEVIPYAEIYGAHPRTFVFDWDSQMIPAARGGYVSAASMEEPLEELDDEDDELDDSEDHGSCEDEDEDHDSCEDEDDGGWELWLLEQENDDDSDYACMLDKEMLLVQENEMMKAQVPFQDIQIFSESRDFHESEHERESVELAHATCLPDLDDETQWESWLEATLGSAQEIFYDPNLCPSQ